MAQYSEKTLEECRRLTDILIAHGYKISEWWLDGGFIRPRYAGFYRPDGNYFSVSTLKALRKEVSALD